MQIYEIKPQIYKKKHSSFMTFVRLDRPHHTTDASGKQGMLHAHNWMM